MELNSFTPAQEAGAAMDFVHLHVHSHYSFLQALSTPEELVKAAAGMGQKALALTDTSVCAGFPKFSNDCGKAKVKPILGMEAHVVPDVSKKEKGEPRHSVVLLAKDREGLQNLFRISSEANLDGFYMRPRTDWPHLAASAKGLVCLSAGTRGEAYKLLYERKEEEARASLRRHREAFGGDFYAEIMRHAHTEASITADTRRVMDMLLAMADAEGIPSVATNDVRYCSKEQAQYHDIFMCLERLTCVKAKDRFSLKSEDYHLKSAEEMMAAFAERPDLLERTNEVAAKVGQKLMEFGADCVPGEHIAQGRDPQEFLQEHVYNGLKAKGLFDKSEYRDRVDYELRVFSACRFTKYFLILWEFINDARGKGIRIGAGRGSAAGSLCLYALGVTALDPIKYNLMFERFLSVETVRKVDAEDFGIEVAK